jgi:hypothetical protein
MVDFCHARARNAVTCRVIIAILQPLSLIVNTLADLCHARARNALCHITNFAFSFSDR